MKRRGYTLIEVLVVLALMGILFGLILAAVQRVRGAANRTTCSNRLRQVGLACHQYVTANSTFPKGMSYEDRKSKMLFASWHIQILPHIEREAEYRQALEDFQKQPYFYSPLPGTSHKGLSTVIPTYICPDDARLTTAKYVPEQDITVAFTSYLGVCGANCFESDGILFRDSRISIAMVGDGLSQTLLIGERPPSDLLVFGWWYAGHGQKDTGSGDMILGVTEECRDLRWPCNLGPYEFKQGDLNSFCDAFQFWSLHPGGGHFSFADGSTRFIRYTSAKTLPALASRFGREAVNLD